MAEIWFGDLECDPINIEDCLKFKKSFEKLYKKYKESHPNIFKEFPEVFVIDIEKNIVELSEKIWSADWHNDKYLKPFILQGGTTNQHISWGHGFSEKNDVISNFTNELVRLIGNEGITFYFQVIMDGGYEDYSISIYPDLKNNFPKVEISTEYNEDDEMADY
tara:strand:+ start:24 stop:512 length:489 start_codon:yes stop_codon:yes gene_type:complete